jgi:hypothetical protein
MEQPMNEKAGSGRSGGKRRDISAAGDKSAPISADAGKARGGKKKKLKREAKSHRISRTLHGTDKEESSRSTAGVPDESELIRAVAAVNERASGVEELRAELEMMLQDQLRIEDSLKTLTGIERSRSSEALACLREAEKQVEFLRVALETERGQLDHALTKGEARELSLRTALDEAERAGLAGKEQFAEVQTLLSRERQRTAELADAVAATENVLAAERQCREGLTARLAEEDAELARARSQSESLKATLAATESKLAEELTRARRAESEQASVAGKLRQKATEADARAEDAGVKVSALEVKTAQLERDIERHEQEAAALLSSTSWRLSAPWRAYRRMVSRLRRLLRAKKINPLFDREWYLQQYPDVRAGELDPYDHYLRHGAAEGRDPSPLFDTDWYLQQNPDVAASKINPLLHYYLHGANEGRRPNLLFDSKSYLENYPDVREGGIDSPLALPRTKKIY